VARKSSHKSHKKGGNIFDDSDEFDKAATKKKYVTFALQIH
jgi:hypothetical protein